MMVDALQTLVASEPFLTFVLGVLALNVASTLRHGGEAIDRRPAAAAHARGKSRWSGRLARSRSTRYAH